MALIDKLTAIADSIRAKTGSTGLMTLDEMPEMIEALSLEDETTTYILVDESGNEIPAVLVDEPVELTAKAATDIRAGTTAVTDEGIVTGEKEIPAYYVTEGTKLITAGSALKLTNIKNCEYTKMQALICVFNTNITNSVSTEKVCISGNVYNVNSVEVLASVTVEAASKAIDFGLINDGTKPLVIRHFSYKEVY